MSELLIDDYIQYRIERAYESLEEAKILFAGGHYATTVSRFYNASFCV